MAYGDRLTQQRLMDATNLSTDAPSVDERLDAQRIAITGQTTPPPPTGWGMSNSRSATRLNLLEPSTLR